MKNVFLTVLLNAALLATPVAVAGGIVYLVARTCELDSKNATGLVVAHSHGPDRRPVAGELPGGDKALRAVFGDGPFYLEVETAGGRVVAEAELPVWYTVRKGDWVEVWKHSKVGRAERFSVRLPKGGG